MVGLGRRAMFLSKILAVCPDFRVVAVCDSSPDLQSSATGAFPSAAFFSDYETMLDSRAVDAVWLATPMHLHPRQAVSALERDIHVLSEPMAGVTIEECRRLTLAAIRSGAVYMLAENHRYFPHVSIVAEMAHAGIFGTPFHARGEYLADMKQMGWTSEWLRRWKLGCPGISYGSPVLGPLLLWNSDDRVARVCCPTTGSHHRDEKGLLYAQDSATMLALTAKSCLWETRLDLVSNRPATPLRLELQGTHGCYESPRESCAGFGKIWVADDTLRRQFVPLESHLANFLPKQCLDTPPEVSGNHEAASVYFMVKDFMRSIRREIECPIGIHQAMDITLPCLVSQRSAEVGGFWLEVPDSRLWLSQGGYTSQLHMIWPQDATLIEPALPPGYRLLEYAERQMDAYVDLMASAGFEGVTRGVARGVEQTVLPNGFFLVEHKPSKKLVAAAMARHSPDPLHPYGGEIAWVAVHPDHRQRGLGKTVSTLAIARLMRAGYQRIYLKTDDHRLPAISIYLKTGFRPFLFEHGMEGRWRCIIEKLKIPDFPMVCQTPENPNLYP